MTDEQIQQRIERQGKLLQKSEREDWLLKPVPLDQLAFNLRMQQLREQFNAKAP